VLLLELVGIGAGTTVLLQAASDYASALANGKVDPAKVRDIYTLPRPKVDVRQGLVQAIKDNKLQQWLDTLAPQTDEYRALSDAFVQLVKRSPGLPDGEIGSGGTLKPGASDPRRMASPPSAWRGVATSRITS